MQEQNRSDQGPESNVDLDSQGSVEEQEPFAFCLVAIGDPAKRGKNKAGNRRPTVLIKTMRECHWQGAMGSEIHQKQSHRLVMLVLGLRNASEAKRLRELVTRVLALVPSSLPPDLRLPGVSLPPEQLYVMPADRSPLYRKAESALRVLSDESFRPAIQDRHGGDVGTPPRPLRIHLEQDLADQLPQDVLEQLPPWVDLQLADHLDVNCRPAT